MANVRTLPASSPCTGYQQITSLSSAVGLTVPSGTRWAKIQAETQNVRWRADGTNPTASVGFPLNKDTPWDCFLPDLTKLKFIEQTASAKLNITYFG